MRNALAKVLPLERDAVDSTGDTDGHLPSWAEEVLTPEQFFPPAADSLKHWTGERRLLFAILQDAVDHFFRYRHARTTRGKRLFRETRDWFWSKERNWLCSFESICAHLSLDADYIRMGLKRIQDAAEPLPSALQGKAERASRHLALVHGIKPEASSTA